MELDRCIGKANYLKTQFGSESISEDESDGVRKGDISVDEGQMIRESKQKTLP